MDFEQCYRAATARDSRFDGVFLLAVRTTGIYCRPSCPARKPKPQNTEFFRTAAAAHEHGYRACKRCLPDAVPGSPEWNLRSDVAARAMRLILDGVVEREGVPGLANRLGYTSRHLNRLLTAELGAGPLALARAQRTQTARALLVETDLGVSEVAFAAGFGSVRQFNDTMNEVYGLSPTSLRARAGHAAGQQPPTRPVEAAALPVGLRLPVRQPFDAAGVFAWLAARAIPGVEDAGPEHYARTLQLPGGPALLRINSEGPALRLHARLSGLTDLRPLVARVRRLFDADADPVAVDTFLAGRPELAASVRATPGIRLPGTLDPTELLIRALVGQQISVAAARTHLTRLATAAGVRLATVDGGPDLLFPTPAAIAAQGAAILTGPATRIRNLLRISEQLATAELSLDVGDDPEEQRARLLATPGIGAWTADYVAMRVLGATDVLPVTDAAIRNGAARLGLPDRPAALADWARELSPWRSYAAVHLWAAAGPSTARRTS